MTRAIKRQGSRCEVINRRQVAAKRKKKILEDRASLEKFVGGVTVLRTRSCIVLKSSILFCKSRMLRKKSFDISPAGLIVRGGASGGPFIEYVAWWSVEGGGG